MSYIHICPKCGRNIEFKQKFHFEKAESENRLCRNCRDIKSYERKCPDCGKTIYYKRKSDYQKASKCNSKCNSCSVNSGKFTKGKTTFINNKTTIPVSSLDNLLIESIESFYWIGFILSDGNFYKTRFEIGLKESDLSHLQKLKTFLNSNTEIKYRSKTNSYRFAFNNRFSIPKVMKKYNIQYNKTYNPCNFDIYQNYDNVLLTAMFIGIIDGDGSIDKSGLNITITAHCSWFNFYKRLISKLNLPFYIRNKNNSNTLIISCGNKTGRTILNNFINKYKLPLLERKWNRLKI